MSDNLNISTSKNKKLEYKYTNEELKKLQAMNLEDKIALSLTRIAEFYNRFPNKIYISLSGGKDSTVLQYLVRKIYPDTPSVFIDTGLEYPAVREFALSQTNVIRIKPEMTYRKVIETYGYPLISKEVSRYIYVARNCPNGKTAQKFIHNNSHDLKYGMGYSMVKWAALRDSDIPISHKCCDVMKKKPAKKFEKETGMHPITAMMASESRLRRNSWLKNGCNAFDSNRPISNPMSFWTEQDVLEYIVKYNIPYAKEVYGDIKQNENGKYYNTLCDRTGCIFCMFGVHLEKTNDGYERFNRLKKLYPKLYEYCMRDWDKGGLGIENVLNRLEEIMGKNGT